MIKKYSFKYITIAFLLIIVMFLTMIIIRYTINTTKEKQTIEQITTNGLIFKYKNESLNKFIEQAIEVDGILKQIKYKNNIYTLYLTDGSNKTYILCELQNDQIKKVPNLVIGEHIKIKGVLKGHLKDIILLNCIIR